MKRLLTLLIAVIICFSLVACGSDNKEQTSDNANQTSNEATNENSDTSSDNADLRFVGTWVGTTNGDANAPVKMIINEDGTGSWEESGNTQELTWAIENDEFVIERPNSGSLNFSYTTTNGVTELNWNNIYVLTLE